MEIIRAEEAEREHVFQIANGDHEAGGSPLLMAKFNKKLPHDNLGQVSRKIDRSVAWSAHSFRVR